MDQRTPAAYAGNDSTAAREYRERQAEMISILQSVASGELRETDPIRARAILRGLGMGD